MSAPWKPIVLDFGSGVSKAGFAGVEKPSIIFPTMVGIPRRDQGVNIDLSQKDFYIMLVLRLKKGANTSRSISQWSSGL
jgi:actin-related protein